MQKLFVDYETAKKLKDKGFNCPCLGLFDDKTLDYDGENRMFPLSNFQEGIDSSIVAAPLYQQVIDWFMDEHELCLFIVYPEGINGKLEGINSCYYDIEIKRRYGGDVFSIYKFEGCSDDYYEALKKAIEYALTLL